MEKYSSIILFAGVSFADWESDLQAALIKKGRLAHIFHNLEEIRPALRPTAPIKKDSQREEEFEQLSMKYIDELAKWKEGEIEAKNILLRRLSPSVRPQNFRQMSAKQIFDTIASTREEGAAAPYDTAVRNLLATKFTTTEDYCDKFMQHYLSVNSAAESMIADNTQPDSCNTYQIMPGFASSLFLF